MIRRAILLLGVLAALPACAPRQQDIAWGGQPGSQTPALPSQCAAYANQGYQGPHGLGTQRGASGGYGSQEYECRRLAQEQDRRRAMAERDRQSDERKLQSAAQSQAQSSCTNAGIDRTLCRNLATLGSVLLP